MSTSPPNPERFPDHCPPRRSDEQKELATSIYLELRAIAGRQMKAERAGHTLTATALVHEAFLRLKLDEDTTLDRGRLYRTAAGAMRRVLIDHARRRVAGKRGGGRAGAREIGNVLDLACEEHLESALELDEALTSLEEAEPVAAEVVRLRFYAGLTGDETARVLDLSPRQVDREWAFARAYLLRRLGEGDWTTPSA